MQSRGTLAELPLEGILDSVAKDRATGTLHMRSSEGEATLYFLFGHLFHATDASAEQGEPVVHRALEWSTGDFTFDAKAKLPAEETIKGTTAELLANRPQAASSNGAHAPVDAPEEADPAPAAPDDAAEPEPASDAESEAADTREPGPAAAATASAADADAPQRRRTDQRPGTRPPETMVLYPVPLGTALHEGLTAGFVDFPKLLRSLAKDGHSGYVRLSGEGFLGVLLFSSGAVVEAIYEADGSVSTGNQAFAHFGDRIDSGEGGLDVIQLTPEMVTGIFQLLTSPSLYERLRARFIKAEALLEHLSEAKTSGAVIVRGAGGATGIVLYREGELLGSYTDEFRETASDARKVVDLCADPAAEIEVRGGAVPETLPVLEAIAEGQQAEVPSASRGGGPTGRPGPRSAPAPAPEAAAEPVPEVAPEAAAQAGAAVEEPEEVVEEPEEVEDTPQQSAADTDANWSAAINEMAGRADAVLGTRAKKVKELLFASGHDRDSVDATIERVAELSIMFVDPSKLSSLADEFRQIAARQG